MTRAAPSARLMAIAWVAAVVVAGRVQADDAFVDPLPPPAAFAFEPSRPVSNDDPDTSLARFGLDAAPWVADSIALLSARRSDNAAARQVALLTGSEDQEYLTVAWRGDNGGVAEVYAVEGWPAGRQHLRRVTVIADDYVTIVAPTGTQPFADLAPILALETGCVCSSDRRSLRLILLEGEPRDITPDWAGATIAVRDLDADGEAEVIALDKSWQGFPLYCSACGPYLPVVIQRREGRFTYACTDFADTYLDRAATVSPRPSDGMTDFMKFTYELEFLSARALLSAQAGAFDQARTASEQLEEAAEELFWAYPSQWHDMIPDDAHDIATTIHLASSRFRGRGCPLSEVSPHRPYLPPWQRWSQGGAACGNSCAG